MASSSVAGMTLRYQSPCLLVLWVCATRSASLDFNPTVFISQDNLFLFETFLIKKKSIYLICTGVCLHAYLYPYMGLVSTEVRREHPMAVWMLGTRPALHFPSFGKHWMLSQDSITVCC